MGGVVAFVVGALLAAIISAVVTYLYLDRNAKSRVRQSQDEAQLIVAEAEEQKRAAAIEAKDQAMRLRSELDRELGQRRKEVDRVERRIEQKEETIDRKAQSTEAREQNLRRQEQSIEKSKESWETERARQQEELDRERNRHIEELERVAGLTADEAKLELVAEVEAEARSLAVRRVREIDQEIHEEADRRSRRILATTIQRIATDYVAESTVSVIPLPSDDMKGRIIGREGRNIRALEQATGVDLIVDDTPEAVTISAFDPVRREVARRALTKLLAGRPNPSHPDRRGCQPRRSIELEQVMREEGDAGRLRGQRSWSASRPDQAAGPAQVPHRPTVRMCWRTRSKFR